MAKDGVYREVKRWLVVAAAVTFLGVVTASIQQDTYKKAEADRRHDRITAQHERDVDRLYEGINQIQQNVDWLVRERGGEPIRSESEEDR